MNVGRQEEKVLWSMSDLNEALPLQTKAMKGIFGDDRHGGCEFHPLQALKSKLPLLLDNDIRTESRSSVRINQRGWRR